MQDRQGKFVFNIGNICLFFLIFLTSSFTVVNNIISSFATIAFWIGLATILIIHTHSIHKNLAVVFLTITILFVVSSLLNGQNIIVSFKNVFSFFAVFLFVNLYDYKTIINQFVKVITFVAAVSIPFYIMTKLDLSFLSKFTAPGTGGRIYYNFILYSTEIDNIRNFGFFWEPGTFATFLNIGIAICLLSNDVKREKNVSCIVLLIGVLLSTFSTTGYVTLAFILFIYLLKETRSKKNKRIVLLIILALSITVLPYYYESIFSTNSPVFGKVANFFQYQDLYIRGVHMSSASVRLFSVIKPLEVFLKNPVFGVGHDNLVRMTAQFTNGSITCTFINWFAIFGIFFGILMLIGYWYIPLTIKTNNIVKILIMLLLMMIISTEDYSQNAFFFGIALIGYKQVICRKKDYVLNMRTREMEE